MPNRVTPAQIEESRGILDNFAAELGRDAASLTISVYGQPADASVVNSFLDAGANRVIVRPEWTEDEDKMSAELERVADAVLR